MKRQNLKEYRAWKAMKSRCYSPSALKGNYKNNNITVCEEWKNDFNKFLKDVGQAPSNSYSLDRINNLEGYYKENVRWATQDVQSNNRGEFNLIYTYNNESHTLKEWSKILNIKYTTLYSRIMRSKLSFEDAIKEDPFNKKIKYNDQYHTMKEWCEILNLPYQTIIDRKHQGWSTERMFTQPIKNIN